MDKRKFKKALVNASGGCNIQHNGWPCGSCFFNIADGITNEDWQAVLFYRGDYKKEELDNLPEDYENNLDKIAHMIGYK